MREHIKQAAKRAGLPPMIQNVLHVAQLALMDMDDRPAALGNGSMDNPVPLSLATLCAALCAGGSSTDFTRARRLLGAVARRVASDFDSVRDTGLEYSKVLGAQAEREGCLTVLACAIAAAGLALVRRALPLAVCMRVVLGLQRRLLS
jgi:hypothetical protein